MQNVLLQRKVPVPNKLLSLSIDDNEATINNTSDENYNNSNGDNHVDIKPDVTTVTTRFSLPSNDMLKFNKFNMVKPKPIIEKMTTRSCIGNSNSIYNIHYTLLTC